MNRKTEDIDILVEGGILLAIDGRDTTIDKGVVAVKDDVIVAIGEMGDLREKFCPKEIIDAQGCLIMPGLVNSHTHAPMSLFRGLADDVPLFEWLNDYIFPAESKLTEDMVYWGALLSCAEMILSGTTTFCDMYLFEDEVARASKDAGMRATVGEVLYDFPSPNYGSPEKGLIYTQELIEKWKDDPHISVAVEPHALFTCSPQLLKDAKNLSERYDVPLVTHLSETKMEVEQVIKRYGKTPVRYLEDIGLLDSHLIANHCVNLTEEDMDLLAINDVRVVHCPESNMKLSSGIAPIPDLLQKGITVGLGTDGPASNNNLDMFQEMDTASKLQKFHKGDPTVMDAKKVVAMATIEGARTLNIEGSIGSLEKGKKADIIIINMDSPHLTPIYNIYSHLVYSTNGDDVVTSIINGKIVMRDRKILTFDIWEVIHTVNKLSKAI